MFFFFLMLGVERLFTLYYSKDPITRLNKMMHLSCVFPLLALISISILHFFSFDRFGAAVFIDVIILVLCAAFEIRYHYEIGRVLNYLGYTNFLSLFKTYKILLYIQYYIFFTHHGYLIFVSWGAACVSIFTYFRLMNIEENLYSTKAYLAVSFFLLGVAIFFLGFALPELPFQRFRLLEIVRYFSLVSLYYFFSILLKGFLSDKTRSDSYF